MLCSTQAESELANVKAEHERLCDEKQDLIQQLHQALAKIEAVEKSNKDLIVRLDEEKRYEDMRVYMYTNTL